jgi:DNA-binding NarL/FixJ family response regulator
VLGLQNREIAAALGTSVNTVRKQLVSLFEKLEVASRAELVAVAMRDALVTVR